MSKNKSTADLLAELIMSAYCYGIAAGSNTLSSVTAQKGEECRKLRMQLARRIKQLEKKAGL